MPKNYFRVDGADKKTGEETYLVLQADSKPQAEKLARRQGLLISSVRVAKPTDWEAAPAAPPPEEAAALATVEPPAAEPALSPVRESAPLIPQLDHPPHPVPPTPSPARPVQRNPAAIVLSGVGAALVLGGALALTLALWPDNTVRNELQQIDFRLHEVSQTVLGSMLVLAGMSVLLMAAILIGRSRDASSRGSGSDAQ